MTLVIKMVSDDLIRTDDITGMIDILNNNDMTAISNEEYVKLLDKASKWELLRGKEKSFNYLRKEIKRLE